MRQILLTKQPDGTWRAECPSLPGCGVRADTKDQAIDSIRDAIRERVRALRAAQKPIPEDTFEGAILLV